MTPYEHLEQLAASHGLLIDTDLLREDDPLDGYIVSLRDGSTLLLINRHRPLAARTAALAEELGHYFRSIGDLRNLRDIAAAKSERLAHVWSVEALLPLEELQAHFARGNGTSWEIAEEVELPLDFVQEAVAIHGQRANKREKAPPLRITAASPAPLAAPAAEPPLVSPPVTAEEPASPPPISPEEQRLVAWMTMREEAMLRGEERYGLSPFDPIWTRLWQFWAFRHTEDVHLIVDKELDGYSWHFFRRMAAYIFKPWMTKKK